MTSALLLACCLAPIQQTDVADFSKVIARAGKDEVTEGHLQLVAMLSGHSEVSPKLRKELTRRLVETRYVTRFLKRSGFRINSAELAQASRDARKRLVVRDIDLRKRLRAMKLTESDLRKELEVHKLWTRYKIKTLTNDKLKARFAERKVQYDGTRCRVSQVFLKVADDAGWAKAERELLKIREQLAGEKMSFAEAARGLSDSPSARSGGDIGWFPYSGLMPESFTKHAFALKKGEVGLPFRSRFGAHLIKVTDIDPGDLSLEDARSVIYRQLEQEAWNAIIADEKRKTAEPKPASR